MGGAIIYESVVGGDWYTLASVSSDDDNLSHKKKEKCQKRKREREREREREAHEEATSDCGVGL